MEKAMKLCPCCELEPAGGYHLNSSRGDRIERTYQLRFPEVGRGYCETCWNDTYELGFLAERIAERRDFGQYG